MTLIWPLVDPISRSQFILPTKTSNYICKAWVLISYKVQPILKFAASWLIENIKGTKLFSYGNNVSDDFSCPKYLRLFHHLVSDDLEWMMVVTVYPQLRDRFLISFIVSSYFHNDMQLAWKTNLWRKAKKALWNHINRFLRHTFGWAAVMWSQYTHWETEHKWISK